MGWQQAARTLALTLTCAALVTACDPDPVPDEANEAAASVDVSAGGDGKVVVALGGDLDEAAITSLLDAIDGDVFVGHAAIGDVIGNGGGLPMLEFRSTPVFTPGEAPHVEVDTRRMCDDIMAAGFTDLEVSISVPNVDADWSMVPDEQSRAWSVSSCGDSPHGGITLRPDPGAFWRSLLLVAVVVAANAALAVIGTRRLQVPRWLPWMLTSIAVLAAAAMIAAAGAAAGDHMEVAGRMGHGVNIIYLAGSLVVVLFGPIAAIAQPLYWRLPKEQRPRLRRRPPAAGATAR